MRIFSIRDFGASGNGRDKDTQTIQTAIDACAAAGGGVTYCPPGTYLSGTIEIKSNVELHIEAGAIIRGSPDRADYRPVPLSEGTHLICAHKAQNIAISGRGAIDGNGRAFFLPPDPHTNIPYVHPRLNRMRLRGWRPFGVVRLTECQDILVRDIHVTDSPMFTLWLLGCDRVRVQGITILNDLTGLNTDGIDVDCCGDVVISDCHIQAGDDAIALKSDTHRLGYDRACENIVVTNCNLITSCSGIRCGYEGDGAIRNCTFNNLRISSFRHGIDMVVPRHIGTTGEGWATRIEHGPSIENLAFSDLVVDAAAPLFLWIGEEAGAPGGIRNISVSDMVCTAERGCHIGGSRTISVNGVRLSNVHLTIKGAMDAQFVEAVPYPHVCWGYWDRHGAPYAFYCRYAQNLTFHQVQIEWDKITGPWQSALRAEGVANLVLDGFCARQAPSSRRAAVHLTDVNNAFLRGCRAEPGTDVFLHLDGEATRNVSAIANDLLHAKKAFLLADRLPADTLVQTANIFPKP